MRRAVAFAISFWILALLAMMALPGGKSDAFRIESFLALIVTLVLQVMLLIVPSRLSGGSRVSRALLLVPFVASALLLGFLLFGFEMAIGEYARFLNDIETWTVIPPLALAIGYVVVMHRKSRSAAAWELLRWQRITLLIAGILILLATIPVHVLVSRRGGFLVGIGTALGLIISVWVTLFALAQVLFARMFLKDGASGPVMSDPDPPVRSTPTRTPPP